MPRHRYLTRLVQLVALLGGLLIANPGFADTWTDDFERICSFTDSAPELPPGQLAALIAESDALLAAPPTAADPQRKIKIFRLQKCRNLFRYMLDLAAADREGSKSTRQ